MRGEIAGKNFWMALAVTLAMFGAIELLVRAACFIRNSNASFAPSFSLF